MSYHNYCTDYGVIILKETNNKYLKEIYLSKDITSCMKGFFTLTVLCHHLYQRVGIFAGKPIGAFFQFLGAWSVTMFLFFSGYGLMFSYITKGKKYVSELPKKRILPFYCIMVFLIIVYLLGRILIAYPTEPRELLQSFFFFNSIISNGWYLQTILLFYIIFYTVFILPLSDSKKLFIMLIAAFAYIFICILLKCQIPKYEATFSFLLGMVWCKYKKEIDAVLFCNKILSFILSFCAFFVVLALHYLADNLIIDTVLKMLSLIAFNIFAVNGIVMVLSINRKLIYNIVLKKIGSISLEIYTLQGFFIHVLHSRIVYIENIYLYLFFVVLCTIISSVFMHKLFSNIYLMFSKDRKTELKEGR